MKSKPEKVVDRLLRQIANRNNSGVVIAVILLTSFSLGMLASWAM